MLHIVCADQNNSGLLTPQGKFLWFGWACVLVMARSGPLDQAERTAPVPPHANHQKTPPKVQKHFPRLRLPGHPAGPDAAGLHGPVPGGKKGAAGHSGRILVLPRHHAQGVQGFHLRSDRGLCGCGSQLPGTEKTGGPARKPSLVVMPLVPTTPRGIPPIRVRKRWS